MKKFLEHHSITIVCLLIFLGWSIVSAQTPHAITLTWNADPSATGGFNVYRGTVSGGPYTKLATVAVNVATYTDPSGTAGTKYFYTVTGLDTIGDESGQSNEVSATALGNPQNPSGLAAVSK